MKTCVSFLREDVTALVFLCGRGANDYRWIGGDRAMVLSVVYQVAWMLENNFNALELNGCSIHRGITMK